MCGIFALSAAATWRSSIEPALEAIGHRGPDDRGSFVSDDESCLLGQVRLSILDLSQAGHQPMSDSSGRFFIVYNGEVYNFGELKRDIEHRHGYINWRSSSDTEVIVEGFAREGKGFLSRLNGIFSLAIFDTHERLLHVLRDPLGIKPLFVTSQSGTVYFCSELKGLLAIDGLQRSLRIQSLADMIGFMCIPEPHTIFQEFQKVSPGILFTYRDGVKLAASELFDLRGTEAPLRTESEIVAAFAEKFSTAVKRQLTADVPISIMLSGGLDSSAIAYETVKAGARVRDAYTISYAAEDIRFDQQGDDLSFARNMAKQLGINLNVIEANRSFMNILPELCGFLEDGISDPAAISTYLISKKSRESGAKVILTGQGADEFLCGYRRHQAERMIQKMPQIMRQSARLVGELLPASIPGSMNSTVRRLKRLLELAGATRNERLLGMYSWCQPETVEHLFSKSQRVSFAKELRLLIENESEKDTASFMLRVDQSYDLRSLNLVYSDRMSMAAGVEARVPFLDFELVRLMNSLPTEWLIRNGVTKYVLRKAMENKLPNDLIYREKAGFGLPLRSWLRNGSDLIEYYLNHNRIEKQGIFSSKSISDLLMANSSGKVDFSNAIFSLVIIQMLLDHFKY